jgi:hypothetical protein
MGGDVAHGIRVQQNGNFGLDDSLKISLEPLAFTLLFNRVSDQSCGAHPNDVRWEHSTYLSLLSIEHFTFRLRHPRL